MKMALLSFVSGSSNSPREWARSQLPAISTLYLSFSSLFQQQQKHKVCIGTHTNTWSGSQLNPSSRRRYIPALVRPRPLVHHQQPMFLWV